MKKKIIALLLVASMVFVLAACGETGYYKIDGKESKVQTFNTFNTSSSLVASINTNGKLGTDSTDGVLFAYLNAIASTVTATKVQTYVTNQAKTLGYKNVNSLQKSGATALLTAIKSYLPSSVAELIEKFGSLEVAFAYPDPANSGDLPSDGFVAILVPTGVSAVVIVIPSVKAAADCMENNLNEIYTQVMEIIKKYQK